MGLRLQRHNLSDRHTLANEEITNANVLGAVGSAFFFFSVDNRTGVVSPKDSRFLLGKSKFCKYPTRWSYIPSALRHGNDLSFCAGNRCSWPLLGLADDDCSTPAEQPPAVMCHVVLGAPRCI